MRPTPDNLILSASDLGGFLSCRHKTALDLAVAKKLRPKPPKYPDPVLEILIARGFEHEQGYVEGHRGKGKRVVELEREDPPARTVEAMRAGADMIVQGQLEHEGWGGYPGHPGACGDVPSALGDWSYEVVDTKLSRETKGTTILQLSLYSEIVGIIQGLPPEFFYVVTPVAAGAVSGGGLRGVLPAGQARAGVRGSVGSSRSCWLLLSGAGGPLRPLPLGSGVQEEAPRGRPPLAGGRHLAAAAA